MSKGAATEEALARLHQVIAEVMTEQLGERLLVNKEAVEEGDAEPEYMYTASPALLTVAARFVRENGISADVGDETDKTSALQKRLDELRGQRGKVVRLSELTPVASNE